MWVNPAALLYSAAQCLSSHPTPAQLELPGSSLSWPTHRHTTQVPIGHTITLTRLPPPTR
jgi:hypothetical protein